MMNESDKNKIINGLADFPIGILTHENLNAKEILMGKASIVLFLSDVFGLGSDKHDMVENILLNALDVRTIPNINQVEKAFKLSNGFLQDYNKVQLIKEKNKNFDKMYLILNEVLNNQLLNGRSK